MTMDGSRRFADFAREATRLPDNSVRSTAISRPPDGRRPNPVRGESEFQDDSRRQARFRNREPRDLIPFYRDRLPGGVLDPGTPKKPTAGAARKRERGAPSRNLSFAFADSALWGRCRTETCKSAEFPDDSRLEDSPDSARDVCFRDSRETHRASEEPAGSGLNSPVLPGKSAKSRPMSPIRSRATLEISRFATVPSSCFGFLERTFSDESRLDDIACEASPERDGSGRFGIRSSCLRLPGRDAGAARRRGIAGSCLNTGNRAGNAIAPVAATLPLAEFRRIEADGGAARRSRRAGIDIRLCRFADDDGLRSMPGRFAAKRRNARFGSGDEAEATDRPRLRAIHAEKFVLPDLRADRAHQYLATA